MSVTIKKPLICQQGWFTSIMGTTSSSSSSSGSRPSISSHTLTCIYAPSALSCQHQSRGVTPAGPSAWGWHGREQRTSSQLVRHLLRTPAATAAAGKPGPRGPADSSPAVDTALLLEAGFAVEQAAELLAYFAGKRHKISIGRVRGWLQILHSCNVQQPTDVVSRCPFILSTSTDNPARNSKATMDWMASTGLTPLEASELLSHWPQVLIITPQNLGAVDAWLRAELAWTSSMILKAIHVYPGMFGCRPSNLALKREWYRTTGFRDEAISSMLIKVPNLLSFSVERNEAQLSALQLLGLSRDQVVLLMTQKPSLMRKNIAGAKQQAKIRYLLQVMQRDILALTSCPGFFSCSLFDRIGPRWAFVALHCEDAKTRSLTTLLINNETRFLAWLKSPSLDEECRARGLTHAQLFQRFVGEWKLGEGREWLVEDEKKKRSGVGSGNASQEDDPPDDERS